MLHRVFEIRLALLRLLGFIASQRPLEQCGAEVLLDLGAQLGISRGERLPKGCSRRVEIAQSVLGRTLVELQGRQAGPTFQRLLVLLAGFFVVAFLVKLLTRGGARRGWRESRQRKRQHQRVGWHFAPPLVDEQRGHQQSNPQPKRPLVALDGPVRHPGVNLFLAHPAKPFRHKAVHVGGTILQAQVKSARRLRNACERLFIQARFHKLPVGPLHKMRAALFAGDRDERAVRRADADGENAHLSCHFARSLDGVAAEVLAIGEEHQAAAFALAFAEGVCGGADRLGDVRAALRNDVHVEFVERGKDGGVVHRERCLQKGRAGECHESQAVALQGVEQILRGEFRALQPVGLHVVGQHGAGGVHGNQHIAAFAPGLFHGVAVARLGQRDRETGQRPQHQRAMQSALEEAHVACKLRLQTHGHQALQQLEAAAFPPCEERGQQRQSRERTEPQRRAPGQCIRNGAHGSLLQRVCASSVCARSRPAPAVRNHGKRSRY